MNGIAAAILAGGKSERLGGTNKALIEIGGMRMIDRVIRAIGDVDCLMLAGGPNVFPPDIPVQPELRIPDLPADYAGPLAGVAAVVDRLLQTAPPAVLLTVAVDTPFFPAGFNASALPLLSEVDVVVGAYAGQLYPTNALWKFSSLERLPTQVKSRTAPHGLKQLITGMRSVVLDYAATVPDDPFANANTPEEVAILHARAERAKPA